MTYKIIGDSCSDLLPEMKEDPRFQTVPLTLELGDYHIPDDENFDQLDFIRRVKESPVGPKTACPSPESYRQAIEEADAEEVYIVTLGEKLSGSYQAAVVGMQMYQEETAPEQQKKVHVFSSDSASAGQLNQILLIRDLKEAGADFETVVEKLNAYIQRMLTFFVLETLETLRKNGRLSSLSAFIATALNIKPIMEGVHGVIHKADQQRGINKALRRMAEIIVSRLGGEEVTKGLRLCIAHVNCPERAAYVKEQFEKLSAFREIIITETRGVSTIYANDGGIVVAV